MNKLILTSDIIDINKPLLTGKELLKFINYEYNTLFLDKFWNNIKDDIWIYIDDNMLKYIGYNCERERDSRKKYLNLLTTNFEIDLDYKILNSGEFKNSYSDVTVAIENNEYNEHNKVKHLILSPDCFKQSLMLLKTNKSKEIKKYYIELEKVFKLYLEYQNKYQELELENKNKELENKELENKKKVEITLRDSFNKRCLVYLIKVIIDDEIIYKFGYTDDIVTRLRTHKSQISEDIELIYCIESKDNKLLEKLLIDYLEQYKFRIKKTINGRQQTELLKVNDIQMIKNKLIELNNDIENEKLLIIKLKNKIIDLENENIKLKQQLLLKDDEIVNELKNKITALEKELSDYKLHDTSENIPFIENKDIVTDRIHKKRQVDKIDPTTLKIIETYDCIKAIITKNPEYGYNSIYRSIKNNNVYKNFRWNYNGEKINPTNKIILEANKIERVIQLDKNKQFVKIYKTKSELCKLLHIGIVKLNKYIEAEKILNEFYYINESSYNGNISDNEEYVIHNSKKIRETNIETNEIIIYKTMKELYEKRGIDRSTLRQCIKNNRICDKYKWEYVNENQNKNNNKKVKEINIKNNTFVIYNTMKSVYTKLNITKDKLRNIIYNKEIINDCKYEITS
jgi:hypothetical protein